MAISENRSRRLSALADMNRGTTALPSDVQAKIDAAAKIAATRKPGEFVAARDEFERLSGLLTESEHEALSLWAQIGPPIVGETRATPETIPGVDDTATVHNVASGVQATRIASRKIDYSEFEPGRVELIERAWEARAVYYALATEREIAKLYWPKRGACRATVQIPPEQAAVLKVPESIDMGMIRDEISGIIRTPRAERTPEQVSYLSKLEFVIDVAETFHEAPLVAARSMARRKGLPETSVYTDETAGLCPHCAGTSVLRPSYDAPELLRREWMEIAGSRANGRFFRAEARRRAGGLRIVIDDGAKRFWTTHRNAVTNRTAVRR